MGLFDFHPIFPTGAPPIFPANFPGMVHQEPHPLEGPLVKKAFQHLFSYTTVLLLQLPSWSGWGSSEVRAKVGSYRAPVGQEWVGFCWDIFGNLAESGWGSWLNGPGRLFGTSQFTWVKAWGGISLESEKPSKNLMSQLKLTDLGRSIAACAVPLLLLAKCCKLFGQLQHF